MKNANAYIFGKSMLRSAPWTAGELEKICLEAQRRTAGLRNAPPDYVLDTLHAAGRLYADKKGKWYQQAFAQIGRAHV